MIPTESGYYWFMPNDWDPRDDEPTIVWFNVYSQTILRLSVYGNLPATSGEFIQGPIEQWNMLVRSSVGKI